jgi:regulator of sirC expression with transglutaminase-like and TPR domain
LKNLKYIYLNQQNLEKSLASVERILILFPDQVQELRDRGLLCYELGRFSQAARDLETYLAESPNARDAHIIRHILSQLGR